MVNYSMERLVNTILSYGFEFVDSALFTCVLGNIEITKKEEIRDSYAKVLFKRYVTMENATFKLQDGYNLENDIGDGEYYYPLGQALKDQQLSEEIDNLDWENIIIRKAEMLGINSFKEIENHPLFSPKEKKIMKELDEFKVKVLN